MIRLFKDNRMLGFDLLVGEPNISHFVTTRSEGCSKGNYATFNCSPYSGDDETAVRANQQLLRERFLPNLKELVIPKQVHKTEIGLIDRAFLEKSPSEQEALLNGVDALITNEPGVCICISTADCVPLLLYDKKNHVVAAIHAGWRGTVERITSNVLNALHKHFGTLGKDLLVGIGPSISRESFEVGEEVYEAFEEKGFPMQQIAVRNPQTNKPHIDLWEANRMQLVEFGVLQEQIECAGLCSYIHHDVFFSARRLGINSGRTLSGIMLNL